MDHIGQKIEVLDNKGEVWKTITVSKQREINGTLYVTDEEGNIYSEDELNLTYRVTPEFILFDTLIDNYSELIKYINSDYTHFDFDTMHKIFNDFMNNMIKAGYIENNKNKD